MNQQEALELEIRNQFQEISPELEKWGRYVDESIEILLEELIKSHKVQIGPKYRLKDENSFIKKALITKAYPDPIKDTSDKVATRIVLLNTDDLNTVSDLFINCKLWEISKDRDRGKEIHDNPNVFDYQSEHFVVWPLNNYESNLDFQILKCEIQVRTLLQHAYAEVSHDHVYKGPYKKDKNILRKLAKSMALMEATDDYFNQIFSMISNPANPENEMKKELEKLFEEVCPGITVYQDQDIFDLFLPLYFNKPFELRNLIAYVRENQRLCGWVRKSSLLLFKSPVIILLAYLARYDSEYLKESWPTSRGLLESLFLGLGYSFTDY